jgi:hypothetical protein
LRGLEVAAEGGQWRKMGVGEEEDGGGRGAWRRRRAVEEEGAAEEKEGRNQVVSIEFP